MPTPKRDAGLLLRAIALVEGAGGNITLAAREAGMPGATLRAQYNDAISARAQGHLPEQKDFDVEQPPSEDLGIDDIIGQRKKEYAQKRDAKLAKRLVNIRVKMDGPIAITHLGDPHVDDDGTDIALIEEHVRVINQNKAMFGANLGDLQNNWIGRLARLWAQQGTSAREAWALTEWLVKSAHWLYLVGGNHDAWSGDGDPLKWMMAQANTVFDYSGVRIALHFPNGKQVRINARHDFTGHSMWNPAHGPMKAIQGGWRDQILTCGHKHTSFIGGPLKDPATGLLSWAIRCAGYKIFDHYAEEKGLPDQNAFPACVTIIDPRYADDDTRLVTVIPSVQEGAEFLKYKRSKK